MKNKWLMMLATLLLIEVVCMCVVIPTESAKAKKEMAKVLEKVKSCSDCHDDFTNVLSAKHPSVKGNVLRVCMKCHAQEGKDMVKPNKFEARLHLAHLKSPVKADCLDCHTWQPGESFGLPGTTVSYGAPSQKDMILIKEIFASAIQSDYLDARHVLKGMTCATCNGRDILGESAGKTSQCLGCPPKLEMTLL
ncbi:MAG: hypothetical protein KJ630_08680 [Proteobacteria bacterium]|nr:hypothetical protein [Pseudomonadota bacterium]